MRNGTRWQMVGREGSNKPRELNTKYIEEDADVVSGCRTWLKDEKMINPREKIRHLWTLPPLIQSLCVSWWVISIFRETRQTTE